LTTGLNLSHITDVSIAVPQKGQTRTDLPSAGLGIEQRERHINVVVDWPLSFCCWPW